MMFVVNESLEKVSAVLWTNNMVANEHFGSDVRINSKFINITDTFYCGF